MTSLKLRCVEVSVHLPQDRMRLTPDSILARAGQHK
jgi:hypothetical protein